MTNRTQSIFFFAIIFLFATGLGLLVFKNYNAYYTQQASAELETATASQTPAPQPKKPVASSAPNQISGWKTYTNDQYGFEFEFPSDWNFLSGGNLESADDSTSLIIKDGQTDISLSPCLKFSKKESITVANNPTDEYFYVYTNDSAQHVNCGLNAAQIGQIGEIETVINKDSNKTFVVDLIPSPDHISVDENIYNTILSSLKFTN